MTNPLPSVPPPAESPVPVDTGNSLLAEGPAQMTATLLDTPAGQRLALTIRTTSTTLTILLAAADAKAWAAAMSSAAGGMSSSGLIVATGGVSG